MIDLQTERILRLNEARRLDYLKGRNGNELSLCTISRWAQPGILVDGERVQLETVRIGGSICTSAEAVERFVARLNGQHKGDGRTTSGSRQAIAKAENGLDDAGIV